MDPIAAPATGEQPAAEREPPRHLLSNNWRSPNASPKAGNTQGKNQRSWDNRRSGNDARQNNSGRRDDWGSRREPARNDSPGIADTDALSEGRRIYVGNLFYHVRPEQVTTAFNEHGFGQVENVHISVDPMTGRNPGYCFVEFETREAADAAIEGMSGVEIEGRSLKTGPCQPKQRRQARTGFSRGDESYKPTFERWGNWTGDGGEGKMNDQGPVGAETHLREVVDGDQRCRVFVGGLGKMLDQEENDKELRAIFKDFNVIAVSKRITPHESAKAKPGKHHYAFVDLESKEEVHRAIETLQGLEWEGARLRVQMPTGIPSKIIRRSTPWDKDRKAA